MVTGQRSVVNFTLTSQFLVSAVDWLQLCSVSAAVRISRTEMSHNSNKGGKVQFFLSVKGERGRGNVPSFLFRTN